MNDKRFQPAWHHNFELWFVNDTVGKPTRIIKPDYYDLEACKQVCELLNELDEKNNELKEFIRNLTNFKGEILLSNGRAYKREYVERLLE